ncbi:MAG: CapA family protein [Myxococcales bacterium]|nr:CapA family protein [Myxococcales bacterium]
MRLCFAALALALAGCPRARAPHDAAHSAALDAALDARAPAATTPLDAGVSVDVNNVNIAPDVPRARRVTVSSAGEVALSPGLVAEGRRHPDEGGLGWLLRPVSPLFGQRAIAFATLRGSLSARPGPPARDRFVADAALARALSVLGVDALNLATDRALDRGAEGLAETLSLFTAARLPTVGACVGDEGPCAPVVIAREGLQVGFLAAASRSERAPSGDPTAARITRLDGDGSGLVEWLEASRSSVDVMVVALDLGREPVAGPGSPRRALVDRLVTAGADLVLVVGPERVGPVERRSSPRGEALVAWSLGSLVSAHGGGWHLGVTPAAIAANPWVYDPSFRDGVVLHTTFDLSDPSRLTLSGVVANAVWSLRDNDAVQAVALRSVDPRVRAERLAALSAALGPAVRVRP